MADRVPQPPRRAKRSRLVTASWALTAIGVLVGVFVGFEFAGTNLLHDRAQETLLASFKQNLAATAGKPPPVGAPAALLSIPRIGATELVVQGTSTDLLKQGPGHFSGSPMPGEFGNVLVLGRRTTYGGPFRHLNRLVPGDQITMTTGAGSFVYVVSELQIAGPGDASALDGTLDSRLTLVTSDPAYLPYNRFIVVAHLTGNPLDIPRVPPAPVKANALGLGGDWADLGLGALWSVLSVIAVVLTVRVGRRWPARVRNLLAAPVLIALFVLLCSTADGILPGTL